MTISDQIAVLVTEAEKLNSLSTWITRGTTFLGVLTLLAGMWATSVNSKISDNTAKQDSLKNEIIKPRKLDSNQETALFNSLNAGPKDSLLHYKAVLDDEADAYREQIINVIKKSGWNLDKHGTIGGGVTGIHIGIKDPALLTPAQKNFIKGFDDAQIPYIYENGANASFHEFYLIFGTKPKLL